MDIHDYLGVLRRGLALIALGTLLGAGAGFVALTVHGPTYSATTRELLTDTTVGDAIVDQSRVASYGLVASSALVLQPVIDQLGLTLSVDELASQITVASPRMSAVMEITATQATPQKAQVLANTISRVFAVVIADQLERASTPTPTAPVQVVNLARAEMPTTPDTSTGPILLLEGGVLGFGLGLLAAWFRGALDRRIRGPKDVSRVTDIPVVGEISADRGVRTNPLVARAGSRTAIAESFRALRAHLDHLRGRDGRRSFVLTAAGARQGTTTVTANLAVSLANTGASVVVVDADLRSPTLSRLFGIHGAAGLTEVLTGRATLDVALRSSVAGGVTVLAAGSAPSNPGELLATPAMRAVLTELRRRFEIVLIDTPTIAEVADAAVLGSFDGSTLLVVAQDSTTRPQLDDALGMLAAGGSIPVGLVLNSIPRRLRLGGSRPRRERQVRESFPASQPWTALSTPPVATVGQPVAEVAVAAPVATAAPVQAPLPVATPEPAPTLAPVLATAPSLPTPEAAPESESAFTFDAEDPFFSPNPIPAELRVPEQVELPIGRRPVPAPATPASALGTPAATDNPPTEQPTFVAEPAAASTLVPDVRVASILDSAFAALPTATAEEQRAGSLPVFDGPPPRTAPASRFAPDLTKFTPDPSVYAIAKAPEPGTEGVAPRSMVNGTIVNTISTDRATAARETSLPRPPITRILPNAAPPVAVLPAAAPANEVAAPPPRRQIAAPVPEPVVPERQPAPVASELEPEREPELLLVDRNGSVLDDETLSPARLRALRDSSQPAPVGSLLGEIGGLPRVEVRAARPVPAMDQVTGPKDRARESYELRSRDLERAARDRLLREQQRLELSIREQLAHDKRELESVLDNRLEDTVLRPAVLDDFRAARADLDGPDDE